MALSRTALYVADLDGTLLRDDGTVSAATCAAINPLVADGLRFTVATARSPARTRSALRDLHVRLPLICLNGAVTVDPHTGDWLAMAAIPAEAVCQLLDAGAQVGLAPFLMGKDQGREALMHQRPQGHVQEQFLAQRAGEPRLKPVNAVRPLDHTLCVTFASTLEPLARLHGLLATTHSASLALRLMDYPGIEGGATLDISLACVDKVVRVAELAASLGVQARDVVVFGDHLNDLPMFAWAGTAVAVGNARQEVLAAADRHCGSNEADGVAQFLLAHTR